MSTSPALVAARARNLRPPFAPGNRENPGGKPVGARNRLTARFLFDLAADFDAHGREAIEQCRIMRPESYLKCIVALCPRESLEVKQPLDEMTDAELVDAIRAIESYMVARAATERADAAVQ